MQAVGHHVPVDWSVLHINKNTFGLPHRMNFLTNTLSPRYSPISVTAKG
jgi:hypothetical protein